MPNGKGSLECCYCVHWQGEYQGYDGAYEEGFCGFHQNTLPSTIYQKGNRMRKKQTKSEKKEGLEIS